VRPSAPRREVAQKEVSVSRYLSEGYCPQCEARGERVEMLLNAYELFECPCCHLQAGWDEESISLKSERGEGRFKSSGIGSLGQLKGKTMRLRGAPDLVEKEALRDAFLALASERSETYRQPFGRKPEPEEIQAALASEDELGRELMREEVESWEKYEANRVETKHAYMAEARAFLRAWLEHSGGAKSRSACVDAVGETGAAHFGAILEEALDRAGPPAREAASLEEVRAYIQANVS
jgi:hypothetical protein